MAEGHGLPSGQHRWKSSANPATGRLSLIEGWESRRSKRMVLEHYTWALQLDSGYGWKRLIEFSIFSATEEKISVYVYKATLHAHESGRS